MESQAEEKRLVKAGVVRKGVVEKVCLELGHRRCITWLGEDEEGEAIRRETFSGAGWLQHPRVGLIQQAVSLELEAGKPESGKGWWRYLGGVLLGLLIWPLRLG